jgi:hypothetical protein
MPGAEFVECERDAGSRSENDSVIYPRVLTEDRFASTTRERDVCRECVAGACREPQDEQGFHSESLAQLLPSKSESHKVSHIGLSFGFNYLTPLLLLLLLLPY